jgi:hypothetical protein
MVWITCHNTFSSSVESTRGYDLNLTLPMAGESIRALLPIDRLKPDLTEIEVGNHQRGDRANPTVTDHQEPSPIYP